MTDIPAIESDDVTLTRRHAIASAGATCLVGAGLLTALSRDVTAEVSMGTLDVAGADATLDSPPAEVPVTVSGEWSVTASATPEQVRTVLQIQTESGQADDLAESMYFDKASGSYELTADLYAHNEISRGRFFPEGAGETIRHDFLIRVILLVIQGGEIVAETLVEDDATLALTNRGLELAVGGTGGFEVVQSG